MILKPPFMITARLLPGVQVGDATISIELVMVISPERTHMITRTEYLEGKATHLEYYAQFVTQEVKYAVDQQIGRDAILKSNDPHFNDIPLVKWDYLNFHRWPGQIARLKNAGDTASLSHNACVGKCYAQQIRDGKA